jgi:hypothetical protein
VLLVIDVVWGSVIEKFPKKGALPALPKQKSYTPQKLTI